MLKESQYNHFIKKFTSFVEKLIVTIMILLMSLILVFATVELIISLYNDFFKSGVIISLNSLMDVFGGFLLILIGIELLETIKIYLNNNVVHVEVVILVAIIALARKIVILKIEEISLDVMAGIGILILSLSVAYFFIKKSGIITLSIGKSDVLKMNPEDINKQ